MVNLDIGFFSDFVSENLGNEDYIFSTFERKTELNSEILHYSNISIIKKGLVVTYLLDEQGNEIILDFKSENQVLRPAVEMDQKKIGILKARCLKDTEIYTLKRELFCSHLSDAQVSNYYYRLLDSDITSTYSQIKLLKISNLELRYKTFLSEYQHANNYITDRQIANYLGIHYTSLARMKKKLISS